MNLLAPKSWEKILEPEIHKEYFQNILSFVESEKISGKIIYPEIENIFTAFEKTSLHSLKVIIIGQDPYHGASQAHGLSFSVQDCISVPPSLKNIYKELKNEYPQYTIPSSGNLEHWAEQGILLLNSILTVEAGKPASHSKIGWSEFTDTVIKRISETQEGMIFVLWGNFAQSKKVLINSDKHFVLESPHPSPFSAYMGFLGNGHFKQINKILKAEAKEEIKW